MPSAITDWGSAQLLAICFGLATVSSPIYVALCNDEPGTDVDGDSLADLEPDPANNYNRIPIPLNSTNWSSPSGLSYIANLNQVNFDNPTDAWGVMTHFALCNQNTSGEVFLYGEFDVPQDIAVGQPFMIPAGGITIGFGSLSSSIVAI